MKHSSQAGFNGITESVENVGTVLLRVLGECDRVAGGGPAYSLPSSGKLVRTRFTILLGDAIGLSREFSEKLAVCAELVHTASLLHDDCVDGSSLRRGRPTANERLGINRAILLGDLVVSKAFRFSGSVSREMTLDLIDTVQKMSEGALLEERFRHRKRTPAECMETLSMKTGELFRWCAVACCRAAGKPELMEDCGRIGIETGVCFQMIDDVLDFESDKAAYGKDVLKDITEGRLTLPVLMAMEDSSGGSETAKSLEELASSAFPDAGAAMKIAGAVKTGGFLEKVRSQALSKINGISHAIDSLPEKEPALKLKSYLSALTGRTA